MRTERPQSRCPFTAVVCQGPVCGPARGRAVVDGLRDSIRRHPHAVLVAAGCVLGRIGCHASAVTGSRRGPVLVVQTCDEQRGADRARDVDRAARRRR